VRKTFNIDWKPFNGMAHRPWLMFFGLIFCIIAWAAGLFLCIFAGYNVTSENETTLVKTSFVAYETSKDELRLSATTGETYIISSYNYYNGYFDNPTFLCNGETYCIRVTNAGYICSMINSKGNQIITFESEREAYRSSQRMAVVLMALILLLTIIYFVTALVVSKNSEWYPTWLVKLLFANASEFWS
jgi:uncharacterized membrane protein